MLNGNGLGLAKIVMIGKPDNHKKDQPKYRWTAWYQVKRKPMKLEYVLKKTEQDFFEDSVALVRKIPKSILYVT